MEKENSWRKAFLSWKLQRAFLLFSIDIQFAKYGPVIDRSKFEGRYYSDKAPGSSLLALPVELALRLFHGGEPPFRHSQVSYRIVLLLIPTLVLAWFLWSWLARLFPENRFAVDLTIICTLLGSVAFPTLMYYFGHQITAVFLISAFLLVYDSQSFFAHIVAGFLAGLSCLVELQAAPTVLLIIIFVAASKKKVHFPGLVLGGILPCVIFMMYYNYECFHNPFSIGYLHLDIPGIQASHAEGIAGIKTPTWKAFYGALFSPAKGLFIFSPLWLCSIPGLVILWKRGLKILSVFVATVIASWIFFISSALAWHAGWSVGPRLLTALVPFLTIPTAAFLVWIWSSRFVFLRPLFCGMVIWSVLVHSVAVAAHASFNPDFKNPIFDHGWTVLSLGVVRPSLVTWLGLSPMSSFYIFSILVSVIILYLGSCGNSFFPLKEAWRAVISIILTIAVVIAIACSVSRWGGSTSINKLRPTMTWEQNRFNSYFHKPPKPFYFPLSRL
jgi:hypothetical protein